MVLATIGFDLWVRQLHIGNQIGSYGRDGTRVYRAFEFGHISRIQNFSIC